MKMITRRDLVVAAIAVFSTLGIVAVAQQEKKPVLHSSVFDWNTMVEKKTPVGSIRQISRNPTPTLQELEMHITTLNPGHDSHAPHHHPNEELVIIREGNVEVLNGGTWKKLGPGSIIFNASNEEHALKNIGTTPAVYHVINWTTAATPAKSDKPVVPPKQ
ncbi:MAG TPA: cupin domain-containing protein [Terriglobales bacterium]|nr:cupin domain-containing protein [Terriglobales bacterium]